MQDVSDLVAELIRWAEGHWQLLATTAAIYALWHTRLVIPLKILVVFFHEVAHALAAVLTGGKLIELQVSPQIGGYAVTSGGNRFVILSAGYLGSLLIGTGLLIAALRTADDQLILGGLGGVLLLACVFFIRDRFAWLFCLAAGAGLVYASRELPPVFCDLALRVIGLTSMIYVPFDIFEDTIRRTSPRSDASKLAQTVGGTSAMWGTLWIALACIVIYVTVRYALGASSNVPLRF